MSSFSSPHLLSRLHRTQQHRPSRPPLLNFPFCRNFTKKNSLPKDILANLFKLQIGGQKHWNVYTHSFLQFGLNSARRRMHTKVVDAAVSAEG